MDTLDLFGDQEESYSASLWLYDSTQGVVALGGYHDTVGMTEAALEAYTGLELAWTRETVDGGNLAEKAYRGRVNLAVVVRVENGDVVSRAQIEDGWVPEWHPRRRVYPMPP